MAHKYDFTSIMDRKGKDSIAVDGLGGPRGPKAPKEGFDSIPMWIADMNFPTVPTISQAIIERAQHPAFGYYRPRDEYFDGIINWQTRRNGVTGLTRDDIGYENGVLGGVMTAVRTLAAPGSAIFLHTPAYIGFTGSLTNAGYKIVSSELTLDEDGIYRIDFEDMDRVLTENSDVHTAVFCSPHNPTGRVWTREELEKVMEIFKKHEVFVISDEIWSDIVLDGNKHIPTQMVSEDARMRTLAMYAPSKTFNLAGLIGSYHIIYNKYIRDRYMKEASLTHYNSMNVLSMHALIGAYAPEGYQWVDELCEVLSENCRYASNFINTELEGVSSSKPEGTYMLYVDCSEYCAAHGKTVDDILEECWAVGVSLQDGRPFKKEGTIRINLAVPYTRVCEAMDRLKKYVFI